MLANQLKIKYSCAGVIQPDVWTQEVQSLMTKPTVSEVIARPTRTVIQMTPAAIITDLLDIFVYDFDERGYAAVFAAFTLAISAGQNALENYRGKALWLRTVPPVATTVEGQ